MGIYIASIGMSCFSYCGDVMFPSYTIAEGREGGDVTRWRASGSANDDVVSG